MKLHWSPRSPFVRKVMIVLHETGQLSEVECVRTLVALHLPPNPDVLSDNPLGKIPTLITEDGEAIYDSRVICEYLDMKATGGLFPTDAELRVKQLKWQVLGDGLTDILLLWRTELSRESAPWPTVTDGWRTKVRATMTRLEAEAEALDRTPFGIGQIAILCALGQLDFRWPECAWRTHFPALAAFEASLAERESIKATTIVDDQPAQDNSITAGELSFAA